MNISKILEALRTLPVDTDVRAVTICQNDNVVIAYTWPDWAIQETYLYIN